MYTFAYSFSDACIHPEQLRILLQHSAGSGKLTSFSTYTLPLSENTERDALQEARHLAEKLNVFSGSGESAVDISSLLLFGREHKEWLAFARELNRFSLPVFCPAYEVRQGKERIFSSDSDPDGRFAALHKRTKVCLEAPVHHEFGLFSYDLAFVASEEQTGQDTIHLYAGGGGGIYGGSPALAPRPASWLGEYSRTDALKAASHLQEWNREFGEISNPRKRRLKSLFASQGLDWIMQKLKDAGLSPAEGVPPCFQSSGEWSTEKAYNNHWVHVPSGRIADAGGYPLVSALQEILPLLSQPLRITPQGNLRIHPADYEAADKLTRLLNKDKQTSVLRATTFACRGLPVCKRAKAMASTILDTATAQLDSVLKSCGLAEYPLLFRMSGCPNGCSRPLFAELALVGRTEGVYDFFAGGSRRGDRTASLMKKSVTLEEWPALLTPVLTCYAASGAKDSRQTIGDWIHEQFLSGRTWDEMAQPRETPPSP